MKRVVDFKDINQIILSQQVTHLIISYCRKHAIKLLIRNHPGTMNRMRVTSLVSLECSVKEYFVIYLDET